MAAAPASPAAAPAPAPAPAEPTTREEQQPSSKIVVVFRAAGGAPILAQPKVKVSLDSKFSKIVTFLRRQLDRSDGVFVYLREAFCPALDDEVGVLARAYGVDGGGPGRPRELHVSYALVPAWG